MKFYTVEIMVMKDGTSPVAIYLRTDFMNAQMAMYQTLASAMANENVMTCTVMIVDSAGQTHKSEYFVRPQETTGDKK